MKLIYPEEFKMNMHSLYSDTDYEIIPSMLNIDENLPANVTCVEYIYDINRGVILEHGSYYIAPPTLPIEIESVAKQLGASTVYNVSKTTYPLLGNKVPKIIICQR